MGVRRDGSGRPRAGFSGPRAGQAEGTGLERPPEGSVDTVIACSSSPHDARWRTDDVEVTHATVRVGPHRSIFTSKFPGGFT